ncbi:HAD-like domain-containing protein, partial [Blyttiomyces helicus]
DIDNCLYPPSSGIMADMGARIHAYFKSMGLDDDEAETLHKHYYAEYGLAIRGLVMHHDVDPLDFDLKVDRAIPLESLLTPDPDLHELIRSMKPSVKIWALTNAGVHHAERVLRILGVRDLFQGITSCDYSTPDFPCKPESRFYEQALTEAGASPTTRCYFADDSPANIDGAQKMGW